MKFALSLTVLVFPSPTSFRGLKLLRGAGWTLSLAVVNLDIEGVEAEWVQARQHAMGVIPTEVQDMLFCVMAVVFVEAALSPVEHLSQEIFPSFLYSLTTLSSICLIGNDYVNNKFW